MRANDVRQAVNILVEWIAVEELSLLGSASLALLLLFLGYLPFFNNS